jgi:hypothetical protein
MGMSRELQVPRDVFDADPSRGGSRGYPLWYRIQVLQHATVHGTAAAAAQFTPGPCQKTIEAWMERPIAYEMTGGRERSSIVGLDQLLLCIFLLAHPDADDDEVAVFIVNNGGQLYSRQIISQRKKELNYTRKRASIEAYQAFLPHNLLRAEQFFNLPPPLGIRTLVPQWLRRLLDFDETAVSLEKCNRPNGSSYVAIRVRKSGHYTKGKKLTVLYAYEPGDPTLLPHIDGSIQNPRRWFRILNEAGTDQEAFSDFVDHVLSQFETSGLPNDMDRALMWDNLRSHLTGLVYNTVYGRPSANRFTIIPRPPYQPKYGPTEYHFAELSAELQRRVQPEWDNIDLRREITDILSHLGRDGQAHNTFSYCLDY